MNSRRNPFLDTWTAHPGQLAFLESTAKIKVLACGRRWGKTDACAAAIVASMLGGLAVGGWRLAVRKGTRPR
jgi:hypothetical protein